MAKKKDKEKPADGKSTSLPPTKIEQYSANLKVILTRDSERDMNEAEKQRDLPFDDDDDDDKGASGGGDLDDEFSDGDGGKAAE